jgi:hypothetical protein
MVFNGKKQTIQTIWRLIMNTVKTIEINKICKTNIITTTIIGAVCLACSNVANAFTSNSTNESSRSLPVKYENNLPKQPANRDDLDFHKAQLATITALTQLEQSIEPRKTREQVIADRKEKQQNKSNTARSSSAQSFQFSNYVEFGIYNATTRLFEDFDYDGFYQTFSVTFDADVYSQYAGERALVFADLYVSRDNGPWELYFTTDTFTIIDDNSTDEYEVLTTLDLGYKTAHYDVLIDLYEVGYSEPVATISSEDIDSLYALPLESADRDEYIVEESYGPEVIISAGSTSATTIVIILCVFGLRIGYFRKLF